MSETFLEIGTKVSISKNELDSLLANLREMGYQVVGPKVKDDTIQHLAIDSTADLPQGYLCHQEAGEYRLIQDDHPNFFEVTTGPQSWKPFFFPPKAEIMKFRQLEGKQVSWKLDETPVEFLKYALIGVRPCDLAAIEIQDKVFIREDWYDPIYRSRREQAFIITVNCMEPSGTCFCASMGTGPAADSGFDLALTELENNFLVEVGSEAGRMALSLGDLAWQPASAFLLSAAQRGLQAAREKMGRDLPDPADLEGQLLGNLNHPRWSEVAGRCLS